MHFVEVVCENIEQLKKHLLFTPLWIPEPDLKIYTWPQFRLVYFSIWCFNYLWLISHFRPNFFIKPTILSTYSYNKSCQSVKKYYNLIILYFLDLIFITWCNNTKSLLFFVWVFKMNNKYIIVFVFEKKFQKFYRK